MTWVVRAPGTHLQPEEKKLFTRVRQRLWDYEPLRASHAEIGIEIEGQGVHLTGRVRTLPQKSMADILVRRVPGVGAITNNLVADPEVVRAVADVLARDPRTAPYVLQVEVRHGLVRLRGQVPRVEIARAAQELASTVTVAAGVENDIEVGGAELPAAVLLPQEAAPSLPPGQVEEAISACNPPLA